MSSRDGNEEPCIISAMRRSVDAVQMDIWAYELTIMCMYVYLGVVDEGSERGSLRGKKFGKYVGGTKLSRSLVDGDWRRLK